MTDELTVMNSAPHPVTVQKGKSTGTKELRAIESSLDSICELLTEFRDRIFRSEEKSGEISARLQELIDTIKEAGTVDDEMKEILRNIHTDVFMEKFYTEKGGGSSVIRMTDATMIALMDRIAGRVSQISEKKFRMSSGDYTPTATVVHKAQRTIEMVGVVLDEYLGPVNSEEAKGYLLEQLARLWDE